MNRPTIICHMMTAVDGRIDCGMTTKLRGVDHYYTTLEALDAPTRVSGRVTAQLEMADKDVLFTADSATPYGQEGYSKKEDAPAWEVIVDTKGTLCWNNWEREKPLLILMSEKTTREYLAYLDSQNISWIVCGKECIDLVRAAELLAEHFGVQRMAVVGGGAINAGFLDAGLLDEVSILLAPGIDGRGGMAAAFDGLPLEREPFQLTLTDVQTYDDGAVWLRYTVNQ